MGLGYRRVQHGWLTESQQACIARLGDRFAGAVAGPPPERGADSPDGVLSGQHEASIQSCQLSCTASAREGDSVDKHVQTLIQHGDAGKDEMLTLSWQSKRGLPCQASTAVSSDGRCDALFVWPMEAIVRGAGINYVARWF